MTELPAWIHDVVIDLLGQEDEHPRLYVDTSGGIKPYDWCPGVTLGKVPPAVVEQAKAIRQYMRTRSPVTGPDAGGQSPASGTPSG